MGQWSPGELVAAGIGALFFVYLLVRLITAAHYQSKKDYERSKTHGTPRTK